AEYHDHDVALAEAFRDLERGATVGSGGDTDEQALFARNAPREHGRILVAHRDHFIVNGGIEIGRDKAGADALNLVETRLAALQHRRILRLDRDDQRAVGQLFAQEAPGAADSSAGADAGDEGVDARELFDVLGTGALVVDLG